MFSSREMEMPSELKAAMDRVLNLEQLELHDSLTNLLTLQNHSTHLHAAQICGQWTTWLGLRVTSLFISLYYLSTKCPVWLGICINLNCFSAREEEKAGETEEEELQTEKNRTDEVDELHDTLLNHQLVRHSFQQAALKIQVHSCTIAVSPWFCLGNIDNSGRNVAFFESFWSVGKVISIFKRV